MSVQNIVDCTGHIRGGNKKDANFFEESLFDQMNELDPKNKLVNLHMFDEASVFIKSIKYLRLSIL